MKTYTYQIGKGTGDEMKKVAFSQEMLADSLGEAADKAKAMTRLRAVHADEDTVHIVDESLLEGQTVWTRSVEEIRQG